MDWSSPRNPARDFDQAPLRVGILLWPSFPLMSLAGLVESLRHAGDHGDPSKNRYAHWEILGAPSGKVISSCGIAVEPTAGYPQPLTYDYLFVIGGLLRDMAAVSPQHHAYIRSASHNKRPIVGVCTGVFVLAQLGLLENKPVALHPYHERDFASAYPQLRALTSRDFVISGHITTVLGGICILSFMSRIIGAHFGPDRSAKTVHQMTLPAPEGIGALDRASWSQHSGISDTRIQKALVTLDAQATQNPSISGLAASLGLSERHFLRLFQTQVGRSPKTYLVDMKLRAAVWMLRHTARSVTQIAYLAGFSSGANLADHCRKKLNATPSQIRASGSAAS